MDNDRGMDFDSLSNQQTTKSMADKLMTMTAAENEVQEEEETGDDDRSSNVTNSNEGDDDDSPPPRLMITKMVSRLRWT
jgi:hypothetical protein